MAAIKLPALWEKIMRKNPKSKKRSAAPTGKSLSRTQNKTAAMSGKNTSRGGKTAGDAKSPASSKLETLIGLFRRKEGATIDQMMTATGWQAHSLRGAMSGALKKKRGLAVTSTVGRDGVRAYRIAG